MFEWPLGAVTCPVPSLAHAVSSYTAAISAPGFYLPALPQPLPMYSTHASDPIPSRRVRISTPTLSPAPLPAVSRQQRNQPAPSCVILRGECSLHHQRFRPVPSSLKQCAGPSISPPTRRGSNVDRLFPSRSSHVSCNPASQWLRYNAASSTTARNYCDHHRHRRRDP